PKEDISDDAMEQWLMQEIRYVNTGKPFEFLSSELYDYLDRHGEIRVTKWRKEQYLLAAVAWRQEQLRKETESGKSTDTKPEVNRFRIMRNTGCFTGFEVERLKSIAKKMLLFDLLKYSEQDGEQK